MDQVKIGEFLKNLRKEKGLTQEQLAEQYNVSRRSVSRWETGSNMPDLSILVELAEFYDVDIKEIIDGARKSEMMNEEVKEVAVKMADYAVEQKSKLLIWVRRISLVGVVLMAIVLGLQSFDYESGIGTFLCYVFSVLAFVVMVILSLYTNGLLEENAKRKKFVKGCKIFVLIVGLIVGVCVLSFIMKVMLALGMVMVMESAPFKNQAGIENYDKSKLLEQYGGDISELFVFPDETTNMLEPTFVSSLKTGFFDTDGYMILRGTYNEEDYDAEVQRISSIECTVEGITKDIKYDEESYALPAYVAIDGFDYEYEYALLDEKNHTITYILLSYPEYVDLREYEEYLKLDVDEYKIDDSLNRFSIYSRYYEDGVYIEYSD
ncbi:MAG: helix-turn-helix transcriptional regulator [Oscillospiraceae bacterium]|nr:helix-turn-helix transcriptional regulator [Oscillospiraceae bacterium]